MKLFNFPMLFLIITFRPSEVLQSLTDMSLDRDSGTETAMSTEFSGARSKTSASSQRSRKICPFCNIRFERFVKEMIIVQTEML